MKQSNNIKKLSSNVSYDNLRLRHQQVHVVDKTDTTLSSTLVDSIINDDSITKKQLICPLQGHHHQTVDTGTSTKIEDFVVDDNSMTMKSQVVVHSQVLQKDTTTSSTTTLLNSIVDDNSITKKHHKNNNKQQQSKLTNQMIRPEDNQRCNQHWSSDRRLCFVQGLNFTFDKYDWNNWYKRLQNFNNQHEHCCPATYCSDQNEKLLSVWCTIQRDEREFGNISTYQIVSLNKLGFVWDHGSAQWRSMFERLKLYRNQYGNNAPVDRNDDLYLSNWIQNNQFAFQSGIMLKGRIHMLQSIGFDFGEKPTAATQQQNSKQETAYAVPCPSRPNITSPYRSPMKALDNRNQDEFHAKEEKGCPLQQICGGKLLSASCPTPSASARPKFKQETTYVVSSLMANNKLDAGSPNKRPLCTSNDEKESCEKKACNLRVGNDKFMPCPTTPGFKSKSISCPKPSSFKSSSPNIKSVDPTSPPGFNSGSNKPTHLSHPAILPKQKDITRTAKSERMFNSPSSTLCFDFVWSTDPTADGEGMKVDSLEKNDEKEYVNKFSNQSSRDSDVDQTSMEDWINRNILGDKN